tara:strand:- start:4078 stop:4443 length:366 start_codon:yes stop_codon:yes gene_type:complete
MVLYYKKVKREVDLDPDDSSEEISKRYNLPIVTTTTHDPVGAIASMNDRLPSNQHLFDEIYKTPFSDRKKLYYSLLEDNFNNLSMDDKLVVMYKTSILKSNITNNYILLCLAILVIIALKL